MIGQAGLSPALRANAPANANATGGGDAATGDGFAALVAGAPGNGGTTADVPAQRPGAPGLPSQRPSAITDAEKTKDPDMTDVLPAPQPAPALRAPPHAITAAPPRDAFDATLDLRLPTDMLADAMPKPFARHARVDADLRGDAAASSTAMSALPDQLLGLLAGIAPAAATDAGATTLSATIADGIDAGAAQGNAAAAARATAHAGMLPGALHASLAGAAGANASPGSNAGAPLASSTSASRAMAAGLAVGDDAAGALADAAAAASASPATNITGTTSATGNASQPAPALMDPRLAAGNLAAAAQPDAAANSASLAAAAAFVLPEQRDADAAGAGTTAIDATAGSTATAALASLAGTTPLAGRGDAAATTPATLAMPADPQAGFDDGLGAQVAWAADQTLGSAEIRLNPEHLGRIDLQITLDGDRLDARFHSANPEVRQALEASLPRLREMLGQHGLQLGQADVGQRDAGGGKQATSGHRDAMARDGGDAGPATAQPVVARRVGLVDEYA